MYYIGYSMSPVAEKKRTQHLDITAEKQLAQKDKNTLHMRSFRLEMTIDEKNIEIEKDRTWKKREKNSMSPKEKAGMHMKARNNMKKLRLVMSPKKMGSNERESKQQDEEFTHVSQ
jgi:hypothetical protein